MSYNVKKYKGFYKLPFFCGVLCARGFMGSVCGHRAALEVLG